MSAYIDGSEDVEIEGSSQFTHSAYSNYQIKRLTSTSVEHDVDFIAEELPIALVYNGISYAVMMGTPNNLVEFAIGFSFSEGIVKETSEIKDIEIKHHPLGVDVEITITNRQNMVLKSRKKTMAGVTGCGICGAESLDRAIKVPKKVTIAAQLPSLQQVKDAINGLVDYQYFKNMTGAFHAAAWVKPKLNEYLVLEDIGRHNALDKLIGKMLQDKIDKEQGFIVISSRISYEMVQKAANFGTHTLIGISAPTSLAIKLAKETDINLIGFAKKKLPIIYNESTQSMSLRNGS